MFYSSQSNKHGTTNLRSLFPLEVLAMMEGVYVKTDYLMEQNM